MKGYYGHIKTIDLSLIRGAYKVDSIYLNKVDSVTHKQTEFFSASLIDLSIEWKALFHGKINGKLKFDRPILKFIKDKVEPKTLKKDSSSFRSLLKGFMPLDINKFEINEGAVKYSDENSKPKVDIAMTHLHVLARNLKNSYDSSALLPASLNAHAVIYGGSLTVDVKINPLTENPTFELKAELKETNLVDLNEFFDAYANVKVSKGKFGLYTEVAAKDGAFKGYVKPIINDLKVMGNANKHDNILKKIWEGFVGTVADVLTNHKKDQFASKIPFEGNLKSPQTDIWSALGSVLENAFIRALVPAIDNDVSIDSVNPEKMEKKTFFEKIFGSKEEKKEKKIEQKTDKEQEKKK